MKTFHGISLTEDGRYVMASLSRRSGGWRIVGARSWSADQRLQTVLLFAKGVMLGVPSQWRPAGSAPTADTVAAAVTGDGQVPTAQQAHVSVQAAMLSGNLLGVVPDDAFLCTLPTALVERCPRTFVAVHQGRTAYRIGVVVDRALVAVYSMAPARPEHLESHLGRIRRHWTITKPGAAFPQNLVAVGFRTDADIDGMSVTALDLQALGPAAKDATVLRAAGASLAGVDARTPIFAGPSRESAFRGQRAALLLASAGMLLVALLAVAGLYGTIAWQSAAIASARQTYERILTDNADLRILAEGNAALARRIMRMDSTFSKRTRWAVFMEELGRLRGEGLYFDQMGTEPVDASERCMRVALSGWATSEIAVTDLIGRVQKSPLLSGVSLSSLERQPQGGTCRFRLLFTLKLAAS